MESHDEQRERPEAGRRALPRLVIGLFLMVIGGLLIADNLGFDVPFAVWSYWPFLLLALGTVKLVLGPPGSRAGGFFMLLAGLYGWVSVFHVGGLSFGSAWPIFLLGGGLWLAIGSALCRAAERRIGSGGDVG